MELEEYIKKEIAKDGFTLTKMTNTHTYTGKSESISQHIYPLIDFNQVSLLELGKRESRLPLVYIWTERMDGVPKYVLLTIDCFKYQYWFDMGKRINNLNHQHDEFDTGVFIKCKSRSKVHCVKKKCMTIDE